MCSAVQTLLWVYERFELVIWNILSVLNILGFWQNFTTFSGIEQWFIVPRVPTLNNPVNTHLPQQANQLDALLQAIKTETQNQSLATHDIHDFQPRNLFFILQL